MDNEKKVVALLAGYQLRPNIRTVLHNLGRLLDSEFELHLIMGPESLSEEFRSIYKTFRFDALALDRAGLGFAFKAMRQYLLSNRPDAIMNVSKPFPLGLAVVSLGAWYDVPTILRVTGDYFAESTIGSLLQQQKRRVIHGMLLNKAYQQSDIALPVGEKLAQKLVRNGFDSDQVEALPQPFDPEPFSPISASEKRRQKDKCGLEPDRQTILFVGRLTWGKGADRVFDIAEEVQNKCSHTFQFCLVGEGKYKNKFRNRFSRKQAYCTGSVPRRKIHRYFQVADLLIHPSRRDALPNVILEALAAQVPVMAAPVGEITNVVTMLYEDPDEYVGRILKGDWVQDDLPWGLGSWDKQSGKYISAIRRVL
ncbi:glycosyltransferase family 4 protein [Salinibacter ruber]|uniref:glycosyltransferase family 4 protein n=1 Tax=Salinibacter ruber TaxID=146919 RepID=UPI002072CD2C|nr:glycosyltransferase family 4 protein [Salinibacter ruber]